MSDGTSLVATGGRPQAIIPHDIESAYRLAKFVDASGLGPKELDTPEKLMIAILTGAEIGLPPMMALQRIAVINGRPVIWGDAALALVLASPLCEDVDEYFEGEGDSFVAVCKARRKGRSKPIEGMFSVEEAKQAGLWSPEARVKRFGKDGKPYEKANDSPWHRFPKRMLQMRARGFCLRDAFPHVLGGLYLQEEMIEPELRDITPSVPLSERLAAAPKAEAGFDHGGVVAELKAQGNATSIDITASGTWTGGNPYGPNDTITVVDRPADEDYHKPKDFGGEDGIVDVAINRDGSDSDHDNSNENSNGAGEEPGISSEPDGDYPYRESEDGREAGIVALPNANAGEAVIVEGPAIVVTNNDPDREHLRAAYKAGFTWAKAGGKRRAIPPEYRPEDKAELAKAWLMGFDAHEEKAKLL